MVTSTNSASRFTKLWNWSTNCLKNTYLRFTLFITVFLSLILLASAFDNPGKKKDPGLKVSAGLNKSVFVGGDFDLNFVASAPLTYDHTTGGGSFDDGTIGRDKDVVESLEGGDFTCGDHVSFLTQITVADGALGSQTIELDYSFLAASTGQPGVALYPIVFVGVNYGDVGGDGIGGVDAGIDDDGGSVATMISNATSTPPGGKLNGTLFQKPATTTATIQITDLEAGEVVIIRIDCIIACQIPSSPTGNLQADIQGGRVNGFTGRNGTISVGQQTVPFKNVNLIGQGDCALDNKIFGCVDSVFTYEANTSAVSPSFAWTLAGNGQFVNSSGTPVTPATTDSIVRVKATAPASNGTTGCFTLKVTITAPSFTTVTCCDSVDVYAKPPAATVRLVEPSICGSSTGQVIVTCPKNPATGDPLYQYSNGGTTWQTDTVFSGIAAGANFSIYVRRITPDLAFACVSDVTNCTNYTTRTCTTPPITSCTTPGCTPTTTALTTNVRNAVNQLAESQMKVIATPNPYNDKVKFYLQSAISGQGSLELYNVLGQKVKTVYQGYIEAGRVQNLEYSVPNTLRSNLIYIFRVGDQKTTGKLISQ